MDVDTLPITDHKALLATLKVKITAEKQTFVFIFLKAIVEA